MEMNFCDVCDLETNYCGVVLGINMQGQIRRVETHRARELGIMEIPEGTCYHHYFNMK